MMSKENNAQIQEKLPYILVCRASLVIYIAVSCHRMDFAQPARLVANENCAALVLVPPLEVSTTPPSQLQRSILTQSTRDNLILFTPVPPKNSKVGVAGDD